MPLSRPVCLRLVVCGALTCGALACSSSGPTAGGDGEGAAEGAAAVTYYKDMKPLIEAKCLACHTEGGIAPFALDDPEEVVSLASFLDSQTASRAMPPWMPGPSSPPMRDDFSLTDDEIALFTAFAAEARTDPKRALGDAALASPPAAPIGFPLQNPDVVGQMAEPFLPLGVDTGEDEFRCFLIDIDVPAPRTMVGFRFVPGNDLVDHHAIVSLYSRDDLAGLHGLDDASDGPGWSCFGGDVPADVARPVGGLGVWTPGNNGAVAYPGTGSRVPANVVAIASMHYNVFNALDSDGNVDPERGADQSSIEIYFAPPEQEGALLQTFALAQNLNPLLAESAAPIPANASNHVITRTVPFADLQPGARAALQNNDVDTVFATGVAAHGHLLMSRFEMIVDEGGPNERVLLDIPAWDFNWQAQYTFVDAIALPVEVPVTVRCSYDNTSANRARVGLDPDSVPVAAGEGTGSEMCIGAIAFVAQDPAQ